MPLIISLGSNMGDREGHLTKAKNHLCEKFNFIEESSIYRSPAVDFLDQPEFLNQVFSFGIPDLNPRECLSIALEIEKKMGMTTILLTGNQFIPPDFCITAPSLSTALIQEFHLFVYHFICNEIEKSFI